MITRLNSTVTELQNVKTAVAQTVDSVKLVPSGALIQTFANPDRAIAISNAGWNTSYLRFLSFASGAVDLGFIMKSDRQAILGYSFDEGVTIIESGNSQNANYALSKFRISVKAGQEVSLFFKGNVSQAGSCYLQANSMAIYGAVTDIVNNDRFVLVRS
jgi:hypothetical protein